MHDVLGGFDHPNQRVRKALESIHEYTDAQANQHKTKDEESGLPSFDGSF